MTYRLSLMSRRFFAILASAALTACPLMAAQDSSDKRKHVNVQIQSGDSFGSGVILRELDNGYLVVTNDHVLAPAQKLHCLRTSSGNTYVAHRIGISDAAVDLAFLWFFPSGNRQEKARVAPSWLERYPAPLSTVVSTGFSEQHGYSQRKGMIVPLLPTALRGGYDLTYSSNVDKGMSGGAVFNSWGFIIGVNAMHADPLWDAELKDEKGRKIPQVLSRRLEKVAIGISIDRILRESARMVPGNIPTAWKRMDHSCSRTK